MKRPALLTAPACLLLLTALLPGQEGIQQGTIKRVDADRGLVTITAGGKDLELIVTPESRLVGGDNPPLAKRLKAGAVKEGAAVLFKAGDRGGKKVLIGLRLADGRAGPGKLPRADTSKLKPLTELGGDEYRGFPGGLYPGGKNERPAAHEAAGLALARQVRPLAADGTPDPRGKIILLSVGMSNTSQASQGFEKLFRADPDRNPAVAFVNGAQGGMTAARIRDPEDGGAGQKYWQEVDRRLKAAGLGRAQVQAAWIKQADAGPSQGFPGYARQLRSELADVVRVLRDRFPNLRLVYLSSRTYGGYARTPLNPEPYAYESAFAVRWLIEDQIKGSPDLNYDPARGKARAPWLGWGPYLWANGTAKRADGFFYDERDFAADGTHLSPSGQEKVGRLLLEFLKADSTARPWFLRPS